MKCWIKYLTSFFVCIIILTNIAFYSIPDSVSITDDSPDSFVNHYIDITEVQPPELLDNFDSISSRARSTSKLKMHEPIRIINDSYFLKMAITKGWSGNGTANNPIIIENLIIDGKGSFACILIEYIKNIYFVIRNCSLYNTDKNWYYPQYGPLNNSRIECGGGILLGFLSNNITVSINNNYCFNNYAGIYSIYSHNILIENNSCIKNKEHGININQNNHGLTINNNYCSNNNNTGIYLYNSGNNTIENNNCSGNSIGISINKCTNITIRNNICMLNNCTGILAIGLHNSLIEKNTCKLNNIHGIFIQGNWYATNRMNKVNNNECNLNGIGIEINNSYWTIINDNICNLNEIGILLSGPLGMFEATNNSCINNNNIGFWIDSAYSEPQITTCSYNNFTNNKIGLFLTKTTNLIIQNNLCNLNSDYGIELRYSYGIELAENQCTMNSWGLFINNSNSNNVSNMIINSNSNYGIYIYQSANNNINNSEISKNQYGIWLTNTCYHNTFYKNDVTNNSKLGFSLDHSCIFNKVYFNNITSSKHFKSIGILSNNTRNNEIKNNSFSNNLFSIRLNCSTNNTIFNNIFHSYGCGIYLENRSVDNLFYNNYFDTKWNYQSSTCSRNDWNIVKTLCRNIVGGPYLGGNFWYDYKGVDVNDDGLGDTKLPHYPGDRKPLIKLLQIGPPKIWDNISTGPTTGDVFTFKFNVASMNFIEAVNVVYYYDHNFKEHLILNRTSGDEINGTYSANIIIPDTVYRLYYLVEACDKLGQWTNKSVRVLNVVDNDPPKISINSTSQPTTGEVFILKVEVNDNIKISNVSCNIWFNGNTLNQTMVHLIPATNYYQATIFIPNNALILSYLVFAFDDSSNNALSQIVNISVIDNDLPEIVDRSNNPTTGDGCLVCFNLKDNIGLGNSYLEYWFDTTSPTNISIENNQKYEIKIPENATIFYELITVFDDSNNFELMNIKKTVIDNDPPSIRDLTYGNPKTGSNFSIMCDAKDNIMLKNVSVYYTFDKSESLSCEMGFNSTFYEIQIPIPITSFSFVYFISVEDISGNNKLINETSIDIIDDLPPNIFDLTIGLPTTGDIFEINTYGVDNIAVDTITLEYWFDNSYHIVNQVFGIYSIKIPNHSKKLHYILTAEDKNKNEISIEKNLPVIDNDKPEIIDRSMRIVNEFTFTASILDNWEVSEVSVLYSFDLGECSMATMTLSQSLYRYSVQIPDGVNILSFNISVVDNAGNWNSTGDKIIVLNKIKTEEIEDSAKTVEEDYNPWVVLVLIFIIIIILISIVGYHLFKRNKDNKNS